VFATLATTCAAVKTFPLSVIVPLPVIHGFNPGDRLRVRSMDDFEDALEHLQSNLG
jgi:hypothetical protein